jgi:AcrR family transcriptional regulator
MAASVHRPAAADAVRLARRTFLSGRRLDMRALAAELGVNRVTLYRWVGSRERLLSEILWSVTERYFDTELAHPSPGAGSRVPELLTGFIRHVLANPGMRRFLEEESDYAMRLLTLRTGGFQPRFVSLVHELLDEDVATGLLVTPVPLDDLAYTAVRIVESYVHLRVITGEPPDADRAGRVLSALLR